MWPIFVLSGSVIAGIAGSMIMGVKNNAPGIAGVYVAASGLFYMIGFKFPVRLTLPILLVLMMLQCV